MADGSRPIGKLSKRQTCTQGPPKQTIFPKKLSTNTLTTVRYQKTFGQAINQITYLLNPNIDLKKKGTQASEDSMSGIANRCTVITNHRSFLHISGSNQILLNEKACNPESTTPSFPAPL
jgi:hypothetical protein